MKNDQFDRVIRRASALAWLATGYVFSEMNYNPWIVGACVLVFWLVFDMVMLSPRKKKETEEIEP